jgi:type I restriction enzyme S subunit
LSSVSKLSEIAEVVDSLHKTPKYSDVGKPMVRCTDVKYGRLKLDNTFKVNDEVFEEFSRRYKPNKNDIIITRVGSYGITALAEDINFCLGQNTSAIISKINPRY